MKQTGTPRIIKRREKAQAGVVVAESGAGGADAPSERELRLVVSGWVREHQSRAEEFRQNYATALRAAGLLMPAHN